MNQPDTNPIRIIIAGGRDFNDYPLAEGVLLDNTVSYTNDQITIVSGGARGADKIGEALAKNYTTNLCIYPAQWDMYGKSAGYKRNALMAANADMLLAFWDGKSKGTKHMIDLATKAGLEVIVTNY